MVRRIVYSIVNINQTTAMRSSALLCLSLMVAVTHGAKILGLMTMASPSHYIWNRALMLELARRGHQVTVFSPDQEKQPVANFTNLVVEGVYEGLSHVFDYLEILSLTHLQKVNYFFNRGRFVCEKTLQSPAARKLLEMSRTERFDLAVIDVSIADCSYGFLHSFGNPPAVGVTAFGMPPWTHAMFGNPVNPSYVNTYDLPFTDRMSFWQRAANLFYHLYVCLFRDLLYLPDVDRLGRDFFGEDLPTIKELQSRVSVVLSNTHLVVNHPQPYVPAMVSVAGIQLEEAKPLPQDLQSFLDSSTKGVVYFNLGTNVKSSSLRPHTRKMLLEAFSELEQNVLWKFETDDLKDIPKNVKISKWLPQSDILAHPNVRVFVSHCGLLSTHESIYRGVPMVGIPFFLDQHTNLESIMGHNAALKLDILTMTKEDVVSTIKEAVNNPSYKENMKKLSAIFRDQPETPLERAVYWTEYVLRHGGAPHLRSAALDLYWYQLLLLDVIGTAVFALVLVLVTSYVVLRSIVRRVFPPSSTDQADQQKKKAKRH